MLISRTYEAPYYEVLSTILSHRPNLCSVRMFCLVFLSEIFQSILFPLGRVAEAHTYVGLLINQVQLQYCILQSSDFNGRDWKTKRFWTGPNRSKHSPYIICYKFVSEFNLDPTLFTKRNVILDCFWASWPNFPLIKQFSWRVHNLFLRCCCGPDVSPLWSAGSVFFVLWLRSIQLCEGSWLWRGNPGMKQGLARIVPGLCCYPRDLEPAGPNLCTQCQLWIVCG